MCQVDSCEKLGSTEVYSNISFEEIQMKNKQTNKQAKTTLPVKLDSAEVRGGD